MKSYKLGSPSFTPLLAQLPSTFRDFLKHKNDGVKMSNAKLKKEKSEYAVIFGELTGTRRPYLSFTLFCFSW